MKHNHTYGRSIFALQNVLASLPSGHQEPGWDKFEPFNNHSWNINLVLNLSTSLVFPQFHCRFGDFFETTRYSASHVVMSAQWCFLAGLKQADGSMIPTNIRVVRPNHEELLGSLLWMIQFTLSLMLLMMKKMQTIILIQILHRLLWDILLIVTMPVNEVTKHKARLNIHDGKQQFGMNYFDTYAPVVMWFAICIIVIFSMLFG